MTIAMLAVRYQAHGPRQRCVRLRQPVDRRVWYRPQQLTDTRTVLIGRMDFRTCADLRCFDETPMVQTGAAAVEKVRAPRVRLAARTHPPHRAKWPALHLRPQPAAGRTTPDVDEPGHAPGEHLTLDEPGRACTVWDRSLNDCITERLRSADGLTMTTQNAITHLVKCRQQIGPSSHPGAGLACRLLTPLKTR